MNLKSSKNTQKSHLKPLIHVVKYHKDPDPENIDPDPQHWQKHVFLTCLHERFDIFRTLIDCHPFGLALSLAIHPELLEGGDVLREGIALNA